jgi:large repetitive protein
MNYFIQNIKTIKPVRYILLALFIVNSLRVTAQTYNVEYAFSIVDYYTQAGNPSDYLCSVSFETMNGGKLHSILSEASRLTHSKGGTLNIPDVDGAPTDFIISYSNGGEFSAFNTFGAIFTQKLFFSNNNCGEIYFNYNNSSLPYYCSASYTFYPDLSNILTNPVDPALPLDNPIQISMQTNSFPIDVFHWVFSVDGGTTWLSSSAVGSFLSAKTLFGSKLNVNDYINQNVLLKLNPWGDPTKTKGCSIARTFKIVRSTPDIINHIITKPICHNNGDGKVKFILNRDLEDNETLTFNLNNPYGNLADGVPTEIYKKNIDKTDNSFEIDNLHEIYSLTYKSNYTFVGYPNPSPGIKRDIPSINVSPPPIVKLTAKHTDISCYGSGDGKITLSATGGTESGYQYSYYPYSTWIGFSNSTTPQITGCAKGSYTLKVKDSNGCESAAVTVEITEPTPLTITVQNQINTSKFGSTNGSISVTAGGGTPPYTYTWKNEAGTTISTTSMASDLTAGSYTLTLTDGNYSTASPNTGCAITNSFTIKQPDELVISSVSTPNSCNGKADGKIVVTATGGAPIGAPTHTYQWYKKNNAGAFDILEGETSSSILNREGGIYKVTVTDANNNSVDKEIPLTDPPAISITGSVTDVPCADGVSRGAITVNATGGTGALSYSWSDDTNETSKTRSNLIAKAYTVAVTDAKGCTGKETFIVNPPSHSLPSVSILKELTHGPSTFNGSDGVITISSTGGTGNYSYTWTKDDQSFTPTSLTSLSAGKYSVTVADADQNKCPGNTATITFDNPVPPIKLTTTQTGITCYCGNNGTITVNITRDHFTDNEVKYTYSWYKLNTQSDTYETVAKSPKSSDNSNIDLNAGTYKVVVADNYKTKDSITVNLKDSTSKINLTFDKTDISCSSSSDGFAKVTATGGTPGVLIPYTYLWDTGATTNTISNKGTKRHYKVTVTDSIGCSTTDSVYLYKPDPLTVTLKPYNPNGFDKGNGSITAEVKGGTADYTYDWSGKDFTGADFKSTEIAASGLKAGNYSVEVKDSKGCTAGASVSLAQPLKLVVDLKMSKPISCTGDRDGEISAQASGGVPYANGDYKYIWMKMKSDGTYEDILYQTGVASTYPGLGAGTYKVKVEDSNGNTSESTNTITLINPEPLAISTQSITDVNCYNDYTGEIHFTVTGGTGSYTYLNDKGESISNNLTKLHAGKHTVKIKDAYCELDHEFIVSEPSAALSVTLARKELSAYHASDAELVATVSGGTFSPDKPCSFKWTGSNSNTDTASSLASGTYKLKVTDNNGCEAEASATFIDPLKVDIVVKDTIRCNGSLGELAARAVGGEPSLTGLPYKYIWYQYDIKTGTSTSLHSLGDLDQADDSLATDLPEGYYSVEIDDNHGRILQTAPFHLTQPDTIKFRVDSMNVSCKGENNGFIRVTTTGGSGLYKYLWNNGSRSNERTNLPPGNYTVEVSDSLFDCAAVPASRTITITEPEKLTLSLQKRDVLVACDGKIEAIAAGGTRPYRFRWNDGEETVDSVKTLLCDGNYKVEVIDKNLCTATASILLPPPLVVKISVQDSVKCFGDNNGSLVVHAQGGVPYKIGTPYRYSWKKQNTSGKYEELTAEKDSVVRGLIAGLYALNITDSIGVTLRADSVFYLLQPETLAIRIQKTDVLCHGASTGAISAVVTGGLKPYRLRWNNGSTDAELQNIKAGVYTITATDRNGCTKQYTASIDQSDSLIIGFTNTVAPLSAGSCDGLLTASVLGGVGPYTYQWSPDNIVGATADKLCRGSYTVMVNDMFGCPAQVIKNLNDAPPPFVVSLYVKDSIQCHGTAAGTIAARVSGGIPFTTGNPYLYIWKKKNSAGEYRSVANSNDSIIGNLTSGWYAFNVQDADKNILSESIEIYLPEPDTLALTVSHTDIPCKDLHNGSASVRVSGGVLPYAYKWSNGETTPAIDNLAPGEYWIEVTDRHGCISRQSVTVTEPELLSVSFQPKLISEYNVCDGSLKAVVRGGTAPFSYAWSGVNSTADAVSSLCAADYSVTVTDAHGCSAIQKITLSNPPALRLSLVVQDSIKCNGNVQGVLLATAQGGIPFASGKKYQYRWKKKNSRGVFETMPAYADSMATDLATGTYACTITDANGISLHQDSVILLPEPIELQLAIQQTNIGCSGADEGSATVIPSGGSLPYAYAWSTGDKTATVRNLSAGPYIVRVTDRNGCVAARQMYISKAAPLYLFLYKKQPVCYQSCDGEIKTTVSGGIAPYSFRWTGSTSTGSEAGSLCAGKYSLQVTDAAGCTIQKNDSLQNPAQLALDLGADRYICSGQTIRYDISIPSKTGISYSWAGPDGFTATTPTVDLTKPGTYTASVTDAAGCSNSGTVTLTPSGTTVANEFALPTQAFVNEKIVIVNTTYPSPDSIRWVLPAKAQILSGGQSYTEFQVPDTGVYVIKMISYKGVCSSEQEKEMIVSARSQLSDIGNAKTPFIQAFSVTPNPSHGELASKVVLQDKADVQLKLINVLSNQVVFQERKSGDSTYEVPINVTVLPGVYLLLLETPKGSATMKVIIF